MENEEQAKNLLADIGAIAQIFAGATVWLCMSYFVPFTIASVIFFCAFFLFRGVAQLGIFQSSYNMIWAVYGIALTVIYIGFQVLGLVISIKGLKMSTKWLSMGIIFGIIGSFIFVAYMILNGGTSIALLSF